MRDESPANEALLRSSATPSLAEGSRKRRRSAVPGASSLVAHRPRVRAEEVVASVARLGTSSSSARAEIELGRGNVHHRLHHHSTSCPAGAVSGRRQKVDEAVGTVGNDNIGYA